MTNLFNKLPLIGLCVSYNYYDTIKFVLPVNYVHFDKIYLITQSDDFETIQFSRHFNNIEILFFNFKNNNKSFDKFGALNYTQKIVYERHPDSWYLIFDSDIILPTNFIDILTKEGLDSECIYGAIRKNVLKTSYLLNKEKLLNEEQHFMFNNILHCECTPPSILGCFQLYKKNVFHRDNLNDAGFGDYYFGHDNFNKFCNLENLIYFHLGVAGMNWNGKVISFIDDIGISINDIYYSYNNEFNNVYYNKECKIIKYKNFCINKSYNWENSHITFLDNFKMDAFGEGHYEIMDKQTVVAFFGGRDHTIIFNDNYTSFTSIRDDCEIVKGCVI